jgi:branched-chain amino acid transport system ATP-binding protein
MPGEVLRLDAVDKGFGRVRIADKLTLTVGDGAALGVIGPNGAGKSSIFNLITGHLKPEAGRIFYRGEDITGLAPSARCRRGIGRSFQIPHPFAGMTVFENVLVGAMFGGGLGEAVATRHSLGILEQTGLSPKANRIAGALTLIDRKRLEFARALSTRPQLLLLDEVAGGLTDDESHALTETITALHRTGIAIVWIEHVVRALLRVVDRLVVLNAGSILADGAPDAVMQTRAVQEIYLGVEFA